MISTSSTDSANSWREGCRNITVYAKDQAKSEIDNWLTRQQAIAETLPIGRRSQREPAGFVSGHLTRHRSDTAMYTAKDYDRALLSPSSVFEHPMDVVATGSMTARQKLEILKRWEVDERALDEATSENMSGGEASRLTEVRAAIDLLCSTDFVDERAVA
jgi:hypothetical protein